jgi:hypothetical protein
MLGNGLVHLIAGQRFLGSGGRADTAIGRWFNNAALGQPLQAIAKGRLNITAEALVTDLC